MKRIVCLFVLCLAALVATSPAAVVIQWAAPVAGGTATVATAGVTVDMLKLLGTPVDLEYWHNGWGTGLTFTFDFTVEPVTTFTITDWVLTNVTQQTGETLAASLSLSGDTAASLGSGSVPTTVWYVPHGFTVDPADVVLGPGNYTGSLTVNWGSNGMWSGLQSLTLNGTVEQIPEPAVVGLILIGGLLLRSRRQYAAPRVRFSKRPPVRPAGVEVAGFDAATGEVCHQHEERLR